MKTIKPKFLRELKEIRERLSKEWENKPGKEIVASIEKRAEAVREKMKEVKKRKKATS